MEPSAAGVVLGWGLVGVGVGAEERRAQVRLKCPLLMLSCPKDTEFSRRKQASEV